MPKIRNAILSLPLFPVLYRARRQNGQMKPEELANIALRYPLIRSLQVPEEMVQFLGVVAGIKPRRILEIGTCRGGTLFALCRLAAPEAVIISIDLPPRRFGGGYGYSWLPTQVFRMFTSNAQKLHLIRADSHSRSTVERVTELLHSEQLDVLFIDGDHSYDGVKGDVEMYSPLVRSGGIVALHDIVEHPPESKCEVNRLWNDLKQHHQHLEIVKDPRQQWAGIGILYISRKTNSLRSRSGVV